MSPRPLSPRQPNKESELDLVRNALNGHSPNGHSPNGEIPTTDSQEVDSPDYDLDVKKTDRSLDLEQTIKQVFDDTNIEMRSILTPDQQISINSLLVYAEHYKSHAALMIAKNLLKLVISGKRKNGMGSGRQDMTEAFKAALAPQHELEGDSAKMMKKLLN